jgi:hypothetical protein
MYTILTYSALIRKRNVTSQTIDTSFLHDVRCSHGKHVAGVPEQLMASCQHRRLEKACFHVVLPWLLALCSQGCSLAGRENDLGRLLGIMEAEDRRF